MTVLPPTLATSPRALAAATLALGLAAAAVAAEPTRADDVTSEALYYTVEHYTPPDGAVLEVGGVDVLSDGRVVLVTRRGQLWIVEDAFTDDVADARFHLALEGLHEGLGLEVVPWTRADGLVEERVYLTQRGEVSYFVAPRPGATRIDWLHTVTTDWGLSGNYHEFAFGLPYVDGRFYVSLNVAFHSPKWWHGVSPVPYRGWVLQIEPGRDGATVTPFASGLRSPCGLGVNAAGELFATDNQGDWMPACPIFHVQPGRFYGHPASLDWTEEYVANGARSSLTIPPRRERAPAAVWLPYKWSRSTGNLVVDDTAGAFGPFGGQLFVGELTNGLVLRTQLEKVRGEYQGAAFLFRQHVGSITRVRFAPDGTLLAGFTNRGWGGLSPADGLARLRWTGRTPMEMERVHLLQDGFEITFTQPVADDVTITPEHVTLTQYDYDWWWEYGSPERHTTQRAVVETGLSDDRRVLTVRADELRAAMCARLTLRGVRGAAGDALLHDEFAYTINQLPDGPRTLEPVAKEVPPPPPRTSGDEGWLRLTYGDAFDAWESSGWSLVDAELDPDDPRRFVVRDGVGALVNTEAASASDFSSRYVFGDAKFRLDFMLPEDGATAVYVMGRYGIELGHDADADGPSLGTLTATANRGPLPPEFDAFAGAGRWQTLDVVFEAPRFDADGRKVANARLARVLVDDVLLHENVELAEPSLGALHGEVAEGPLVIAGDRGPVALRSVRVFPLGAGERSDAGWTSIFNGEDLAGWTATPDDAIAPPGERDPDERAPDQRAPHDASGGDRAPPTWTADEGTLLGEGRRSHLFSPRGDYRDVEVRARVRLADGGDAGLRLRARPDEPRPSGYEIQLNGPGGDANKTGSVMGHAPVTVELVPAGTWVELHAAIRDVEAGTEIVVRLNGVVVNRWIDAERRHAAGHVALGLQHDATRLEVRDLQVRALD